MKPEPVATYRVQLNAKFTLHAAAALVPYLARLGVDHLYTSPSQQSVPGSTSGYDVTDPGRITAELGGEAGHLALSDSLAGHGMRRMADIVPNHMAIVSADNPWWYDVLKHGKSSRYAAWFDVDWDASDSHWTNQVLLPVLGDQFGRVLEQGDFTLTHVDGQFALHYFENVFPLEPSSTAGMLARVAEALDNEALGFVADSLQRLPRPSAALDSMVARRHRDQAVLADFLQLICYQQADVRAGIDAEVTRMNASLRELGELIEAQNYRLAHWRAADLDLGYRRFFNINSLAGLRVELPEVFAAVHALPLQWVRSGQVHALRVDHPDGLRDPAEYMRRLRSSAPDTWIVIEKILEPGEQLPDWPVQGTTGYDFANRVQGLFVDPAGEGPLTACYEAFVGQPCLYEEVLLASKRHVLADLLGSEVTRLTSLLRDICETHWRNRDHTRTVLSSLLVELATGLPVYRTYLRPGAAISAEDRTHIATAIAFAKNSLPDLDEELLAFVHDLLLMQCEGKLEEEFALRFQQLTGPAMAKGLEDTAFYRYFRLTALNEVGGSPGTWGCTVAAFHEACVRTAREQPLTLLATSTHDTKRSEDVRARLLVLSEIPEIWTATSKRWREMNMPHRDSLVDANTEYLYYQTLVGAWPVDAQRMWAYMEKAVREAKVHTAWTRANEAYETAVRSFVERSLADRQFVSEVEQMVAIVLLPGRINSLAQTLIKLTAPGVPDIYQGCELWDLSLVDPDNRRPVDFDSRMALLDELPNLPLEAVFARIDEGLPKLWLIQATLQLRREYPACFGNDGTYEPLACTGSAAAHVVAFVRGGRVATIVPRLLRNLVGDQTPLQAAWGDTTLQLPPGEWQNRLDPSRVFAGDALLSQLLGTAPVALLVLTSPAQ